MKSKPPGNKPPLQLENSPTLNNPSPLKKSIYEGLVKYIVTKYG